MENAHLYTEVYIAEDTESRNLECKARGYRRDVFVKYKEKFYKMTVFSLISLNQNLKNSYELQKFYFIESNLLVVKKVVKSDIINAVLNQARLNYFDYLRECEVIDGEIMYPLDELTKKTTIFPISISIKNLIRIY